MASGELAARVKPPNLLERGRLGLAFNQMTDGLAAAQRELLAGESRRCELAPRLRPAQARRVLGQVAACYRRARAAADSIKIEPISKRSRDVSGILVFSSGIRDRTDAPRRCARLAA